MHNNGILVVAIDDEEINLMVIEGILGLINARVETTTEPTTAFELVRTTNPDVVLLDVMMPGMDGFEVCEKLKADPSTSAIPIVLLTALDAREHRIAGIAAGADEFLMKPIDESDLIQRVRSFAARRRETPIQVDRERRPLPRSVEGAGLATFADAFIDYLCLPDRLAGNVRSCLAARTGAMADSPNPDSAPVRIANAIAQYAAATESEDRQVVLEAMRSDQERFDPDIVAMLGEFVSR